MPTASLAMSARPGIDYQVGTPIPPMTPHAVSVSLPRWQDNVDYEEGRLGDVMQTGYPRFFIHKSIQKLARNLLAKFGQPGTADSEAEDCILVPSKRVADCCRSFMQEQHERQGKGQLAVRSVQVCVVLPASTSGSATPGDDAGVSSLANSSSSIKPDEDDSDDCTAGAPGSRLSIYVVLFAKSAFPIAKFFWQHTGDGISSRMADACLDLLEKSGKLGESDGNASSIPATNGIKSATLNGDSPSASGTSSPMTARSYSRNRHYARGNSSANLQSIMIGPSSNAAPALSLARNKALADAEGMTADTSTYVEERYGRNMARIEAPRAKRALRKRIAGVASDDVMTAAATNGTHESGRNVHNESMQNGYTNGKDTEADKVDRSDEPISEDDVWLYPTGMSAIFHAHQLALAIKEEKSVCFGFPYLDTLKVLEKWGPGCFFFGHGDAADLDRLGQLLAGGQRIASLFCEFPSNPLLRSPDLVRLRQLADKYDFIIVIDETVGNFVNVQVLPYADIVVSSLTKIFTGEANGMGGALVINRKGASYDRLCAVQADRYEDDFFDQNAIFLERNSRDFAQRVHRINDCAMALIDSLCRARKGRFSDVIKNVYYPTLNSRGNFDRCKRPTGGYGGLFSLTFHSTRAAVAFYDALACAKGPSLGTNFTLASPFVILAHYTELDWAAQYGVEANLVRVSVGLEDAQHLIAVFNAALEAGKAAVAQEE